VSIKVSPFCIYKKDTPFRLIRQVIFLVVPGTAQRFALTEWGRDETTPFCRNQLQATKIA
jgi:hypothetical protein